MPDGNSVETNQLRPECSKSAALARYGLFKGIEPDFSTSSKQQINDEEY